MSQLVIPDEFLNKTIILSIPEIVKYKIEPDGTSLKYENYLFENAIPIGDNKYSVKIVKKENFSQIKSLDETDHEILLRNELRENKLYCGKVSKNYNMSNYHYLYFDTTK